LSLPFLNALPDSGSYRVLDGDEIVNSGTMDGGSSRSRADYIGATSKIDVIWTCGQVRYNYIRAFFRSLGKGASPFQIKLIFEGALPTLYTAQFVPGTFGTVGQQGLTYKLGATLEVTPMPINAVADAAIIAEWGVYGDNGGPPPPLTGVALTDTVTGEIYDLTFNNGALQWVPGTASGVSGPYSAIGSTDTVLGVVYELEIVDGALQWNPVV